MTQKKHLLYYMLTDFLFQSHFVNYCAENEFSVRQDKQNVEGEEIYSVLVRAPLEDVWSVA